MEGGLDISSLERAVARLREGLARYAQDPEDTQIRDGLIQRFEFTYELSHKMLKRYLVSIAATPERYDGMAFADLIRDGNAAGLLRSDWAAWRHFRDMRATTSHSYEEAVALAVVADIPAFLAEALFLMHSLRARLTP
jgi:nucleotidyltransferase substrate binding protein (TIGR01987 family)